MNTDYAMTIAESAVYDGLHAVVTGALASWTDAEIGKLVKAMVEAQQVGVGRAAIALIQAHIGATYAARTSALKAERAGVQAELDAARAGEP